MSPSPTKGKFALPGNPHRTSPIQYCGIRAPLPRVRPLPSPEDEYLATATVVDQQVAKRSAQKPTDDLQHCHACTKCTACAISRFDLSPLSKSSDNRNYE